MNNILDHILVCIVIEFVILEHLVTQTIVSNFIGLSGMLLHHFQLSRSWEYLVLLHGLWLEICQILAER